MTTYFRGVPSELIEASIIDGASYAQIFRRIMLPLATPALVTVAVLQFIQIWDDLLIGLLFLQTPDVRTITVGLATLQSSRIIDVPVLMAGSLVSAMPAVIVYLIFQRYLIAGLTMGMSK
jgi:multiple sugar transport system permease protein/raffinose/stachyose/melibiose transport system permease protein